MSKRGYIFFGYSSLPIYSYQMHQKNVTEGYFKLIDLADKNKTSVSSYQHTESTEQAKYILKGDDNFMLRIEKIN